MPQTNKFQAGQCFTFQGPLEKNEDNLIVYVVDYIDEKGWPSFAPIKRSSSQYEISWASITAGVARSHQILLADDFETAEDEIRAKAMLDKGESVNDIVSIFVPKSDGPLIEITAQKAREIVGFSKNQSYGDHSILTLVNRLETPSKTL